MKIIISWTLGGCIDGGLICLGALCSFYLFQRDKDPQRDSASPGDEEAPKIVNIVNFIRLLEPRDPAITEDVLYQTFVKQVGIMEKYKLGGTFLVQYDALLDPKYQQLLKSLPGDSFEI